MSEQQQTTGITTGITTIMPTNCKCWRENNKYTGWQKTIKESKSNVVLPI